MISQTLPVIALWGLSKPMANVFVDQRCCEVLNCGSLLFSLLSAGFASRKIQSRKTVLKQSSTLDPRDFVKMKKATLRRLPFPRMSKYTVVLTESCIHPDATALCVCWVRQVEIWRKTFGDAQVRVPATPLCGTTARPLPLLTCRMEERVFLIFVIASTSLLLFIL